MTTSPFVIKHTFKLLTCWIALALIGIIPTPITSAAVPSSITITGVTCSNPTFSASNINGIWTTNYATTTCKGIGTITISAALYINGIKSASASNTCYLASSCTLRALSAIGPQNATWRVSDIAISITGVSCSGATPTAYYINGQRVSNAVRVSCQGTGTITVSGKLYINGIQKDARSATCYGANVCYLPNMYAVAKETDRWSVIYN